ncbi:hypothetical protein M408DRAFT_124142 [Serendipita vermifera MAFF 305830]|uniref:Uncharacterized protein n=1 Tax=Serendipita vermifera MAFF 305830 TaxID=933852 RepID=A0A0C3A809_SERVB|nr:hypothetical protein M408DRAFT_124142 [Serendipita vermifera MAFF 305830]
MDGYLCPPSPYPRSRRSSHSSMTSNSSDAAYLSGSELGTSYTSPSSLANSPMQPWARLDSYAGSHVQSSELLVPESSYGRNPSPLQSPNHGITRPMHRSDASTMSSRSSPWAYDSDPLPSPFPSPYSTSSAVSRSPISPAISFNHHHGFPSGANNPHAHPMLLSSEVETDTTHITDGLGLFTLDVPDIDFELPPPSIDPNGTTHASTADQSIPKMYAEGASKPN